jgi:hypothetical protein
MISSQLLADCDAFARDDTVRPADFKSCLRASFDFRSPPLAFGIGPRGRRGYFMCMVTVVCRTYMPPALFTMHGTKTETGAA